MLIERVRDRLDERRPRANRLGASAFRLMLAVVVVRCVDLEPTNANSLATPPGNSRWMSKEYCCTYGDLATGSTMEKLWPTPVRLPKLLAAGCRIPAENGFVRFSAGVALPSTE